MDSKTKELPFQGLYVSQGVDSWTVSTVWFSALEGGKIYRSHRRNFTV